MNFPAPDIKTHNRLMLATSENVGPLSAKIMSACVAFLVGSVGPEKTAEILREWATAVMRRQLVKDNVSQS